MKSIRNILCLAVATVLLLAFGSPANAFAKAKKTKPAITMRQAKAAAMQSQPGATIKSAELEHEDGQFIYSFDMKTTSGIKEVWVDAMTGKVTKSEDETPAHEKSEAAQDKAATKGNRH